MYILYFYSEMHEYYHGGFAQTWFGYPDFRPGEGFWLVPGTDPEDPLYCH